MTLINKSPAMNEADTRAELIEPALKAAGWGEIDGSEVRREYQIAPGRLQRSGQKARPIRADFALFYKGRPLAVIEAKAKNKKATEGLAQANEYAKKMRVRFSYATNGLRHYRVDLDTGRGDYIESYPSPPELWRQTKIKDNSWRDRFAEIPFEEKNGTRTLRYYQNLAVTSALDAIAEKKQRMLLTLATGTGKTAIAFHICWKLFYSRWNLNRNGVRRPRILFLADRNILANQALNEFNAFPDDALTRITPEGIRKKGRVPKNASLFFTIFQTFMSGESEKEKDPHYYGEYPHDFFDMVIIDECHRGGAMEESNWRKILEHFSPAVHLGLTATPRREENRDTYEYFGEPLFTYSLKQGITDGFLTPFKIRRIQTELDTYTHAPDDYVIRGEIDEDKTYGEADFNTNIQIKEREEYRVKEFRDNENTIPTILTTSQKLSTGVDARDVRHIVLMRYIRSMIEFKQIIGRGTRLFDGKDYFTIHDFVNASRHFSDPEWDGEPEEIEENSKGGERGGNGNGNGGGELIEVKLADGKIRKIKKTITTSFSGPNGTLVDSQTFVDELHKLFLKHFKTENDLQKIWGNPTTRKKLLDELAEKGCGKEQINELQSIVNAPRSDVMDAFSYIAFSSKKMMSREEKLPTLIELKYGSTADAARFLGDASKIRETFTGFQKMLYEKQDAA